MMNRPTDWYESATKLLSSSIRNKIIIPYALLTLILAVFGVFVVTRLVAGSFEERLKNQLLEAGRLVSDEVVSHERLRLEIQRAVANTIGVAEALVERDFGQLEALIEPIIVNSKGIDSIVVLDAQGKDVLRLQRETLAANAPVVTYQAGGANFYDWPAVSRVLQDRDGGTKEIQLARDPASNELIVYTIGPIQGADGVVGAVLAGTYLQKELSTLRGLALADVTLFDEEANVIATTFPLNQAEAEAVFDIFTPERYRQVIEQQEVTLLDKVAGVQDISNRGQTYRLAYAPFMLRNRVYGVYGVALPTNFITDTNNQSRNWLALIFSVGVITVFGIGYLISRRIIRPIIHLVQTSRAITAGDLSRRTGIVSGDEIGVLAETFDHMTTELQRLLKLQQEEASKLNAILNSIADGVIVQDVTGKILITNPAAEAILAKLGDDLSRTRFQYNGDKAGQPVDQDSTAWLNSLTGLEFHETERFEMGEQVLSALSAPVVTPDGQHFGSVVVLRDITREVESEKLKDDFITSVSHELRTPLTAIKGYNELLRMTAAGKLDEQQLQFIETIEANVADLLNLIQEMLDLTQIDAGELGIDQEPINLSELVEIQAEPWRDKMAAKEISFEIHSADEPLWIEGDWNRLGRVIDNLLSNAHAYTLPGGRVELFLSQTNGRAQVDIADTGVGISEADQRYLFNRFFRAIHAESTYEISGAGLGLYISKAIIKAHPGGDIWVETSPNQGSTFSFALPIIEFADDDGLEHEPLSLENYSESKSKA